MFLTFQFPFFDHRNLQVEPNRVERPIWPNPGINDYLRYFGAILKDNPNYIGPWDGNELFCNANSVINLYGLGQNNFYKSLKQTTQSKAIFRRFQSDGYFMGKFEIGFSDFFENTIDLNSSTLKEQFLAQINKYLHCEVKIKTGIKLSNFVQLADIPYFLHNAYFWSTKTGKRSFDQKEAKNQIEELAPTIIIHVNKSKIPVTKFGFDKIELKGTDDSKFELYKTQVAYLGTKGYRYFDIWVIAVDDESISNPQYKNEFSGFPEEINGIRRNLLKIPVNYEILSKLNSKLQKIQASSPLTNVDVQISIASYVHNLMLKLVKDEKSGQSVTKALLTTNGSINDKSSNPLFDKLESAYNWVKVLPSNQILDNIKKQFTENYLTFIKNKKKTIYISSTFRDLKDYRADLIKLFQNELSKQFELSQIMEKMYDDGDFTPFSEDCTAAVDKSDIYLIILGNKVGSFPPNETRTYTEIELDFAIFKEKKMFCFMLDPFDEKEISDKAKHDEIIGKFKGRPTHKFKNYNDLENLLLKHLYQLAFE
jgi:nucleoside 2-deoxyribosyltransferase